MSPEGCVTCLSPVLSLPPLSSWNLYPSAFFRERFFLGPDERLISTSEFDARLTGKICSYTTFTDNWDGEGAAPISADAVADCLAFLNVIPSDIGVPKPMPLPSGEVSLYWDLDSTYAEFCFDGTQAYYAFGKGPGGEPVYIERASIDTHAGVAVFPHAIRTMLANAILEAP